MRWNTALFSERLTGCVLVEAFLGGDAFSDFLGTELSAHQERVGTASKGPAGEVFQAGEVGADFLLQPGGPLPVGLEVEVAAGGGDGEAGGDVEPSPGHVGQAGALAADQVLDLAAAFNSHLYNWT